MVCAVSTRLELPSIRMLWCSVHLPVQKPIVQSAAPAMRIRNAFLFMLSPPFCCAVDDAYFRSRRQLEDGRDFGDALGLERLEMFPAFDTGLELVNLLLTRLQINGLQDELGQGAIGPAVQELGI